MKIALALIVKGDKQEAEYLKMCLSKTAKYVDKIFITATYRDNKSETKEVEKTAKLWNADISYYKWNYSFADARNYNFNQVSKEYDYILWLDADDIIRGLEKLRTTLEENKDKDIFSLFYMYAFDEYRNPIVVHTKSQIIKNNGCVRWEGDLHEDFKPLKEVKTYFIKGIERIHLATDEHFEENKKRNLEVSAKQLKKHPDDPRSYWNLGNSQKALGMNAEAIITFKQFIKKSESPDEKYIAKLRMAEAYWSLGKKVDAIEEAQSALGIKPEFPDAYNLLGALNLEMGQYERASDMLLLGLAKKPPYLSILVYNPRDYDYVPLMNLAKAYFQMSLPSLALEALKACQKIIPEDSSLNKLIKDIEVEAKEFDKLTVHIEKIKKIKDKKALKKKIESLPKELQAHPAICHIRNVNFVKEKSSGKDIVFFCGFTARKWTPETAEKEGIGGSEEAIIHLAKGFAGKGWNVEVYNNCGHEIQEFDGVIYKPFWMWNYRDKQEVTVLWRSPKMADYEINSDKVIVDLHDVIEPGEFTEERLKRIDKVFVKSEFHKGLFPNIDNGKFVVVPNGIVSKEFEGEHEKDPYLMINTSSPDRGLKVLVELFKKVKKQVPKAKLKWAYGWGVWDVVHGDSAEKMEWKDKLIKEMEDAGVENLDRISHPEVAKLYKEASIYAYPSEFAEIDCISLSKALASNCVPVTTDFSAMGEKSKYGGIYIPSKKKPDTWCLPYQFDFSITDEAQKKQWVEMAVKQLKENIAKIDRKQVLKDFDWNNAINIWNKICTN